MKEFKTLDELSIPERRAALQGDGARPNMARIKECLLGIHGSDSRERTEQFAYEIGRLHAVQMHDWIVELEQRFEGPSYHELPFEIGEPVELVGESYRARTATEIRVVGLDITSSHPIKVRYFICGSGTGTDWYEPSGLRKLSAIERLGALA